MEKTVNKSTAGVSLIEIMISLVLVAILLMAITSTFPSVNKNRKGIQEADQAKILATQVLDGLQYLTIEGECPISVLSGNYLAECTTFVNKYTNDSVPMGIIKYKASWTTDPVPAAWGGKTVTVTVGWKKSGKEHNVKVTGAL